MLAREYSMAAEEQQRLIDLYAPPQSLCGAHTGTRDPCASATPSNPRELRGAAGTPFNPFGLSGSPRSVLTQAEVYSYPRPLAANILPQRPQPFGAWGNADFHEHSLRSSVEHAYADQGYVTGVQATNDLDRIARAAGIKRIFVGSGIHRNALGKVVLDADLVTNDKIAAADVMKRHKDKGLRISVLDLGDPIDERLFNELQAAAAKGAPYEFVKNSKPLLALRASASQRSPSIATARAWFRRGHAANRHPRIS